MMGRKLGRWCWGLVTGLALVGGAPACTETPDDEAQCAASCTGTVVLSGGGEVPEGTGLVDAAFCHASGCVTGLLDLREVASTPRCAVADLFRDQTSVCATRSGATQLQVEGKLSLGPSSEPTAGDVFTLRLTDHETGEELLKGKGTPEYSSHEICGLTCWSAEMSL